MVLLRRPPQSIPMHSTPLSGSALAAAPSSSPLATNAQALLVQARSLQAGAQDGKPLPALLAGKRLGLMSHETTGVAAQLFCRAAAELGAHVSLIQPRLDEGSSIQQVEDMARLLGQLYDAVECQGMAEVLVRRLGRAATIPVYAGLAGEEHPSATLIDQLQGDATPADKRRWLLQAALLTSIA